MNTSTLETAPEKIVAGASTKKHLVDPKSPEFVHELMRCFNRGRQKAIAEFNAARTNVGKQS